MKQLSSYYSDDEKRTAHVYLMDEITYMVEMIDPKQELRVYIDTMGQAELLAEDFVSYIE